MIIFTSEKTGKVLCKFKMLSRTENGREYTDVKFYPNIYLKDISNKETLEKYAQLIQKSCGNEKIHAYWEPSDLENE